MKVLYHKKFLKDLANLPSDYRKKIEKEVFEILPMLKSWREIVKAEKLQGFKEYYKIRFGDYRLGFRIENEGIVLERVLHRKEIYRYFPIE
ncbi:type II toxin-antitoxin system RelE/ParE family toxin [soil metagenome]